MADSHEAGWGGGSPVACSLKPVVLLRWNRRRGQRKLPGRVRDLDVFVLPPKELRSVADSYRLVMMISIHVHSNTRVGQ